MTPRPLIALTETGRSLLAGATGALMVLTAAFWLTMPAPALVYAGGLGLLVFVGVSLALPRQKTLRENLLERGDLSGHQALEMDRFVTVTRAYVTELTGFRQSLDTGHAALVDDIGDWASRIIDNVIDDPSDLNRSTKFELHLKAAVEVIKKLLDLKSKDRGARSDVIADIEAKTTVVLGDIRASFEQQYESNLENNILDVDVDLDVLHGALKRQGL